MHLSGRHLRTNRLQSQTEERRLCAAFEKEGPSGTNSEASNRELGGSPRPSSEQENMLNRTRLSEREDELFLWLPSLTVNKFPEREPLREPRL